MASKLEINLGLMWIPKATRKTLAHDDRTKVINSLVFIIIAVFANFVLRQKRTLRKRLHIQAAANLSSNLIPLTSRFQI